MIRNLFPLGALLLGSALLLFAGGLNGLILPIRGEIEGFTAASLGLLGTGWALGYVLGCLFTPWLVKRVGHVRSFGAMCAIAAITVLASLLFLTPWVWIPLRGLAGFCFAGAAMVVESWLNDKADNASRGRIFGVYTMVNLGATTAGQLIITLGDPAGYLFFVLAAMVYCLALLPTAVSATTTPTALVSVRLDLKGLWLNSPIAVFSVLMVGVSNAAFGALSAVYAARIGLSLSDVALFASVPVLAGALAQVPVGALSDKLDRRVVLVGVGLLGLCADATFIFAGLEAVWPVLAVSAVFGASVYAMYPLIVAHANDHAPPGTSLQVSGGLLLVFGVGSIVGPTVAGFAMTGIGTASLFWVTGSAHVLLILFALLRIRTRAAVAPEDKTAFRAAPSTRATTPETAVLAGDDDAPLTRDPE
ncbi:putative MFS-type transporter YcaD [Roseivivax sp. THAF40]|uniref:MFS transporter n=1 Tax=unclassified Roseivivax TaxID=2639302 RepID=UPI001269373E|nr:MULTISPECIES: MFS transporter [unclassified Roseivivax]QFS83962.1 putative MFS-type transporter YcaD [Roseivivax sp. THAF197b]QFT47794.1 putative MFS-type transporter YcaD [Roseivivax sp. THAF40]